MHKEIQKIKDKAAVMQYHVHWKILKALDRVIAEHLATDTLLIS